MLQASILQPTGLLNLDLPDNGTKIHSCVTILHRRHGKDVAYFIFFQPSVVYK